MGRKILLLLVFFFLFSAESTFAASAKYYVDCALGNDSNSGLTENLAWKTITKVNNASFLPGDQIFLKRGCVWATGLVADWNGTQAAPIVVDAYGTGENPTIQDVNPNQFATTGSFVTIKNMKATMTNPQTNPQCLLPGGAGVNFGWRVGFNLGGHDNSVINSEASHLSVGFNMGSSTFNHKILNNYIHDNDMLYKLEDPADLGSDTQGAAGIFLGGDNHEVGNNRFERNWMHCNNLITGNTNDGDSIDVELYNANDNNIHHNTTRASNNFTEMGHDSGLTASNNIYTYNLMESNDPTAVMFTIHPGAPFGPIIGTKIFNNVSFLTGINSVGLSCGCDATSVVRNNIFVANKQAAWFRYPLLANESNNIFWRVGGNPVVSWFNNDGTIAASSKKADPLFVSGNDFHLQNGSPARDLGTDVGLSNDLDGTFVPQGSGVDIGAFEFVEAVDVNSLKNVLANYLKTATSALDFYRDQKINSLDFVIVVRRLP